MKTRPHRTAVTLVEMLIVVAVVAILTAMVIRIAGRVETQAGQRLADAAFELIDAALAEFADQRFRYADPYGEFTFPLDCSGLDQAGFESIIAAALGTDAAAVSDLADHTDDPYYFSSCGLYFFLALVPECRKSLEMIDKSLVTDKDSSGNRLKITIDDGQQRLVYPLLHFIDPWGTSLRYSYCDDLSDPATRRNFPLLVSAGPDRLFGTADDVTNK